jgi:hypothetical protein
MALARSRTPGRDRLELDELAGAGVNGVVDLVVLFIISVIAGI